MLRHNLLLIYRNFKRFKSTFFINLIGLSTGLACTLLIYLWVNDELSFDRFHENDSRLYQVMANHHNAPAVETFPYTPDLLAETMAEEMPEIEYATPVAIASWLPQFTLTEGENNFKASGQFAGKDFFKICFKKIYKPFCFLRVALNQCASDVER